MQPYFFWPLGESLLNSSVSLRKEDSGGISTIRRLEFESCWVEFVERFEDVKLEPNKDFSIVYFRIPKSQGFCGC